MDLAIDAPGGFLFEWWSVFWDIFIARTNEKHSDVAASYIEVCILTFFIYFFLYAYIFLIAFDDDMHLIVKLNKRMLLPIFSY